MAKPPAKKAQKRPARPPARRKGNSGRPAGLFTWIATGLVVIVVVALIVVEVTNSSSNGPAKPPQAITPTVLAELTTIPASTFNAVGIQSPGVPITPPVATKNQPLLKWAEKGVKRPTIFYFGAEYCPFCAAERWPFIIALSRFGTFTGLETTQSSSIDVDGNTPTFTFEKSTYTSPYINFFPVEFATNIVSSAAGNINGYKPLEVPTALEQANVDKYDSTTYVPGASGQPIPFISFANQFLVAGASYDPASLDSSTLTHASIAADLANTNNLLTKGILTTANFLTAAICDTTQQQPSDVCDTAGVKAADSALKIST